MKRSIVAACIAAPMLLGGCSQLIYDTDIDPAQPRPNMASTAHATDRAAVQKIDLTALVRAKADALGCQKGPGKSESDTEEFYRQLARFDACPVDTMAARNQIQDTVLLVSDRHCMNYITLLQSSESNIGFATGALSTITGGLSSIFTNSTTARSLGGASGIITGLGAEYDGAYFKQQLVGVLLSGINMERKSIHEEIAGHQRDVSYTLEHALKDAIRYNAACSLTVAVDKIKDQIAKKDRELGLDEAQAIILKASRISASLDLKDASKQASASKTLKDIDARLNLDDLNAKLERAKDEQALAEVKKKAADEALQKLSAQLQALTSPPVGSPPADASKVQELKDQVSAAQNLSAVAAASLTDATARATAMETRFKAEQAKLIPSP